MINAHQALAGTTGSDAWTYSNLNYRREVLLPADPAKARTNAPLFVELKPLGNVDLASVKVDEVTGTRVACESAAYAQPSGRDPRAYWSASGTTNAGQTRRFLIYYNKLSQAPTYPFNANRTGSTFGTYTARVQGTMSGFNKNYYTLTGDRVELRRASRDAQNRNSDQKGYFYEKNPSSGDDVNQFTYLTDLQTGWSPLDGIRVTEGFQGEQFTGTIYFTNSGQEKYFDSIKFDRNGPTLAMNAHYAMTEQIAHQVEVSHRLFKGQPLFEYSFTATANGKPADFLQLANDITNNNYRQFYWKKALNLTTQTIDWGNSNTPVANSNTLAWIIASNSSDDAAGFCTLRPGARCLDTGASALREEYTLASQDASIYIYYGIGKRSNLIALFDTLKRGYPLGIEQEKSFNIVQPAEDTHLIPGESLNVVVSGPAVGADLSLRVDYPNGSSQNFTPGAANTFNLGTIGAYDKFGVWTLSASSGGVTRTRKIEVKNPVHPNLLFTPNELAQIKARWSSNPGYAAMRQHLLNRTRQLGAVPATPDGGIRDDGRDLIYLAVELLFDPNQPTYRQLMWSNFDTIIHWPNWDPWNNGSFLFPTDDVVRGEIVESLATVYDWHYNDLTPDKRRSYAELLAHYADMLIDLGYADVQPWRFTNYNLTVRNRYINQCAAIAAVDRVVGAEVPEARHVRWRQRLDTNFANVMKTLSPDGTINASAAYNALSYFSLFFWTEIQRVGGDSTIYQRYSFFNEAPYALLYGIQPGRVGNYGGILPFGNGDAAPYAAYETLGALIGTRLGNPVGQWLSESFNNRVLSAYLTYWPVWKTYTTPPQQLISLPNWHYFPDRGLFTFRSSWANDATWITIKCGSLWGGHEHPDAGSFVLHRNGFPYVAATHYLLKSRVDNENIMLVNGTGIRGLKTESYADPVDPKYYGKMERTLGSPNYFNVLANPQPAYTASDSTLTAYTREFVGFGDVIIQRDNATCNKPSSFQWLLHGYKTDAQTDPSKPYDQDQYPNDPVFFKQGTTNVYRLYPNQASAPNEWMTILDVSRSSWTTSIGSWKVTPQMVPGYVAPGASRASNNSSREYTRGQQLNCTLSGATTADTLHVFHFRGDDYTARRWDPTQADDGVIFEAVKPSGNEARIKVVWPKGGTIVAWNPGSEGFSAFGTMAMRNYETKEYGGRDLTLLQDNSSQGESIQLVNANHPVTLVANFWGGGNAAWIAADQATEVTLLDITPLKRATFDGQPIPFKVNYPWVTFSIPAAPRGGHLVTSNSLTNNAAGPQWEKYQ